MPPRPLARIEGRFPFRPTVRAQELLREIQKLRQKQGNPRSMNQLVNEAVVEHFAKERERAKRTRAAAR